MLEKLTTEQSLTMWKKKSCCLTRIWKSLLLGDQKKKKFKFRYVGGVMGVSIVGDQMLHAIWVVEAFLSVLVSEQVHGVVRGSQVIVS